MFRIPLIFLLFMALAGPGLARDEGSRGERAGKWVKRLLSDEDPKEATDALVGLGIPAVRPLLDGLDGGDPQKRERIEKVLQKLAGVEETFDLPTNLIDPVTKGGVKFERSDRLVSPSISDDGERICLALISKDESTPPKVIVIDREEEKIRAVIDGREPRLSSNGRIVVFLRPVGDAIRFYATFYSSTTSVFFPDTRGAFDLDPESSDNHFNLTLSKDGLKAAFQARMTCYVRDVRAGAKPILECEGELPALSPDGRWLARLDVEGRVTLRGLEGGRGDRDFGPLGKEQEVYEIRAMNDGKGVVFTSGPKDKPKGAHLWGLRSDTCARGVLAPFKGCKGLSVSENGRILFRTSAVLMKKSLSDKTEKVASRSDSAGLSPAGHLVVYVKGKSVKVVFVGR